MSSPEGFDSFIVPSYWYRTYRLKHTTIFALYGYIETIIV